MNEKEGAPKGALSRLLVSSEVVFRPDLLELLQELREPFDEETVFSQTQVDLPFTPEAQESAGCVWSYSCESDSHFVSLFFSHDVFCFLPAASRQPRAPTEGGGPVKGYLTARQKCLFSTAWFSRSSGK